jgi:predicted flap endonuclease-1-like 5' DNA nuclease
MKVIAAEVAAHLGMLTRKAATESRATTGEMASAEPAAHAGAAAEPAHVSAAHVSATEPAAHVAATTEPPAVSTPTTVSTPASPAARKRISGQSPGESGSRRQNDHGLA